MEPGTDRLLHPENHGQGSFPYDAVVVGIGPCIGPEVTFVPIPISLLDHVHDRLVMDVDHQGQTGPLHHLEDLEQPAMIVNAQTRHMRVIPPGIGDHVYLEAGNSHGG